MFPVHFQCRFHQSPRAVFAVCSAVFFSLCASIVCPLALAQPPVHLVPDSTVSGAPLNVAELLRSGGAQAFATRSDIGTPQDLFEGRLLRSAALNPASVTLLFNDAKTLSGFRVWFSNASGNPAHRWQIEGANSPGDLQNKTGSYRVLVRWTDVAADDYAGRSLPRPVSVRCLRLSAQRLTGDNFVHFRAWQLFTPRPDAPSVGANAAPVIPVAPKPFALLPQTGEIALCGSVVALDNATGRLTLQVTSYTLPSGKESTLPEPKTKIVRFAAQTKWCSAPQQMKPGTIIEVAGPDTGSGSDLTARLVSVR